MTAQAEIDRWVLDYVCPLGLPAPAPLFESFHSSRIAGGCHFLAREGARIYGADLANSILSAYATGGPCWGLERQPLAIGQGLRVGRLLSEGLGFSGWQLERAVRACGIFSALMSAFDIACDDFPYLMEDARPHLDAAFDAGGAVGFGKVKFSEDGRTGEWMVRDACLKLAHAFLESSRHAWSMSFIDAVRRSYRAQRASSMSSGPAELESVMEFSREKSALPIWIWYQLCGGAAGMEAEIIGLGELFWLMDDVSDVVEDLNHGRWNYCLIKHAEELKLDWKSYCSASPAVRWREGLGERAVVQVLERFSRAYQRRPRLVSKRELDLWLTGWLR